MIANQSIVLRWMVVCSVYMFVQSFIFIDTVKTSPLIGKTFVGKRKNSYGNYYKLSSRGLAFKASLLAIKTVVMNEH